MHQKEIEERLVRNDAAAKSLKARFWDKRMDKLKLSKRKAKTRQEYDRLSRLEGDTMRSIQKYRKTFIFSK